jgi:hypothetical protein
VVPASRADVVALEDKEDVLTCSLVALGCPRSGAQARNGDCHGCGPVTCGIDLPKLFVIKYLS